MTGKPTDRDRRPGRADRVARTVPVWEQHNQDPEPGEECEHIHLGPGSEQDYRHREHLTPAGTGGVLGAFTSL